MLPAKTDAPRVTREFTIELLSGEFRNSVEALSPDLANQSQSELEQSRKPTEVDYLLRKRLWQLSHEAMVKGDKCLEAIDVYGGICSRNTFFSKVLTSPQRVAWIMTHPQHDITRMEAGFSVGLTNLLDFVAKAPTAETAGAFLKAMEMLWNRVHGPVIQKIQAQHAHVNMNKPLAQQNVDPNARLEELKAKLAMRDVSAVDVKVE
jgi:hypothetical protein